VHSPLLSVSGLSSFLFTALALTLVVAPAAPALVVTESCVASPARIDWATAVPASAVRAHEEHHLQPHRAGWKVLVLERNERVGGAVMSGEITRPGFVQDL